MQDEDRRLVSDTDANLHAAAAIDPCPVAGTCLTTCRAIPAVEPYHAALIGISSRSLRTGAEYGFSRQLGAGLHIERCDGLGYKEVHADRYIVVPFTTKQKSHRIFPEERSRFDKGDSWYFIFEQKIAWLIDGYRRTSNLRCGGRSPKSYDSYGRKRANQSAAC